MRASMNGPASPMRRRHVAVFLTSTLTALAAGGSDDATSTPTEAPRLAAGPTRIGPDAAIDCRRASMPIETLVCATHALGALDRRLADTYRAALATTQGRDRADLRTTQRRWRETRDACTRSSDRIACAQTAYETRIAELQARHALVPAFATVRFDCNGPAPSTIVATFYDGEPLASVRLVRGAGIAIGVLARSGSGARYVGAHGLEFWNKGDDAQVRWPEGTRFDCTARR